MMPNLRISLVDLKTIMEIPNQSGIMVETHYLNLNLPELMMLNLRINLVEVKIIMETLNQSGIMVETLWPKAQMIDQPIQQLELMMLTSRINSMDTMTIVEIPNLSILTMFKLMNHFFIQKLVLQSPHQDITGTDKNLLLSQKAHQPGQLTQLPELTMLISRINSKDTKIIVEIPNQSTIIILLKVQMIDQPTQLQELMMLILRISSMVIMTIAEILSQSILTMFNWMNRNHSFTQILD